MENLIKKPDNFDVTSPEKQQEVKAEFDGKHIIITGNSEEIKKIIEEIMEMNEWNVRNVQKSALKTIDDKSSLPLNADILTSNGKMVRILIDVMPNNIVVTLGGGGNSILPEEMKKEISRTTSLEI